MPKVRMIETQAGADFTRNKGEVVDVTDAEYERFIEVGIAEAVDAAQQKQRATKQTKKQTAVKGD